MGTKHGTSSIYIVPNMFCRSVDKQGTEGQELKLVDIFTGDRYTKTQVKAMVFVFLMRRQFFKGGGTTEPLAIRASLRCDNLNSSSPHLLLICHLSMTQLLFIRHGNQYFSPATSCLAVLLG